MPYSGQVKEVQIPDGTIWEIPGGGGGGSVDPATATPLMDGIGAVGTSPKYAREDHVHPSDTSRQETLVSGTNIKTVNGNSLLGSGDLTTPNTMRDPATNAPLMDGTAAVGTSVKYAREDHVHPSDTSKQNVLTAGTGISIVGDTISSTVHGIEHLEDSSNASGLRQINATAEDSSYSVGSDAAAFGSSTKASGSDSFAEGYSTTASNSFSHAEGSHTTASGISSHAEGAGNVASGLAAHAEGNGTRATGEQSHAQNLGTIAQGLAQTAIGKYNVAQGTAASANPTDYAFIIGNGADDNNRSNAFAVYWDGRATLGANPTANMDAATKGYVDGLIPAPATATPYMDGGGAVGTSNKYAREDHEHPIDTSRAPTSHASSATTYGVGTTANYGHVKLANNLTQSSYSNGVALSAYQGYLLKQSYDSLKSEHDLMYLSSVTAKNGSSVNVSTATDTNIVSTDALPSTGVYIVHAVASFQSNASGRRHIRLSTSSGGATINRYTQATLAPANGAATVIQITATLSVTTANQKFHLVVYQNSGGTLSVTGGISYLRVHP